MTTLRRISSMLVSSVLLAACGPSGTTQQPPPIEDTALGEMAGTLDRARAVEELTLQHKEAIDQAVDRSEGGSSR